MNIGSGMPTRIIPVMESPRSSTGSSRLERRVHSTPTTISGRYRYVWTHWLLP